MPILRRTGGRIRSFLIRTWGEAVQGSLIDDDSDQSQAEFQHLVETEAIQNLNRRINQLVASGWELQFVRRIELSEHSELWHALLKRPAPAVDQAATLLPFPSVLAAAR